jgi:hypothetical protein
MECERGERLEGLPADTFLWGMLDGAVCFKGGGAIPVRFAFGTMPVFGLLLFWDDGAALLTPKIVAETKVLV